MSGQSTNESKEMKGWHGEIPGTGTTPNNFNVHVRELSPHLHKYELSSQGRSTTAGNAVTDFPRANEANNQEKS